MIDARLLYEDETWGWGDYQPIIDALGKVVIQVDDEDYQGDSRVLYRDGDKVGYLQFGWGSCSGCDALQGCNDMTDLQALVNELEASVKWFDSIPEAYEFFKTHDWRGDYSYHMEEQKKFVETCLKYLAPLESYRD